MWGDAPESHQVEDIFDLRRLFGEEPYEEIGAEQWIIEEEEQEEEEAREEEEEEEEEREEEEEEDGEREEENEEQEEEEREWRNKNGSIDVFFFINLIVTYFY